MSTATSLAATAATASATSTGTSGSNGSNGPSSPLLFFVALGFGVVFTNLWIIVGVKYCFRYNQRNRQRMAGEDPDGVDLGAMPRQHRRRREKKLMTMDEVNEKFPLTKYKTWRSNRADAGLSTAGGINTASRPPSIHNHPRDSKDGGEARDLAHTNTFSTVDEEKAGPEHGTPEVVAEESARPTTPTRPRSAQADSPSTGILKVTTNEEEEDDEQIQTAVPAEQLPDPGDACAICIDTIEDDDDIRGLQCGHAFHASCVDPWLTSRRACCPLCKADYYVPKPRPEGAAGDGLTRSGTNADVQPPAATYSIIGGGRAGRRPAMIIPGRFLNIVYHDRDRHGFPVVVRAQRTDQIAQQARPNAATDRQPQPESWRSRLTGLRFLGRNHPAQEQTQNDSAAPEVQPTPSQLEAGR
ncbi:hypothetical protein EDD36DRAFT_225728 [Exophiala viscosa]|uniref:RING-type domain-containing protein n=1 Tax=Exophiala viscosa TaxID=2486360 RepID=A0AAN6DY74_9EURO|nr:hypothetical protein EDD36DRAFT_225728 [Exophiala viscosa]